MSKILNGMDHLLSVDQMGGLDSCELVTKVMSDLRLCDHSFCTSLGSLVCWKLTTPVGWSILAYMVLFTTSRNTKSSTSFK